ncbi:hypothetical protein GLW08_05660 [Pontibacillus yanchengensis]|uniref:Uncharacterized protein n=2 Tax=Pontibacillus yanchengensis TaxID=462910 RepID=A0ACC7VDP9_9BACI|nr:hypothetical protein [Pontibacillus yanchengensis]MYL32242.1 hypothetical protein [Pontibacillus yanchengensis]MYL52822.1 hypothetical protein [Pontibacillus yanchengensis]
MAEKKDSNQEGTRSFDDFMFGPRPTSSKSDQGSEKNESFDIGDTTGIIIETYNQLSPYVKEVSKFLKNWKS